VVSHSPPDPAPSPLSTLSLHDALPISTARRGVKAGEIGMLMAVAGTLLKAEVVNYEWILVGVVVGSAIGVPLAMIMPMTAVPQQIGRAPAELQSRGHLVCRLLL